MTTAMRTPMAVFFERRTLDFVNRWSPDGVIVGVAFAAKQRFGAPAALRQTATEVAQILSEDLAAGASLQGCRDALAARGTMDLGPAAQLTLAIIGRMQICELGARGGVLDPQRLSAAAE